MPRGVSRTGRRVCLSAYTVPLPSLCSCLCVAGPCVAGMSTTKSVVVQCGAFNRIVSFSTAAPVGRTERELLCEAIRVAYSERIGPNEEEQEDYYCGTCEGLYGEGEEEYWIGCDGCFGWFHGECVSVTPETEPETFFCPKCLL